MQFSNVIGSALGSVLMAAAGVAGAFLFNAAGYAALFRGGLGHKDAAGPGGQTESTFTAEFREGLAYIYGNKPVLWLILSFAAFNFFVGPILILIPMIVKFTLKESVTWLAVFETFFALGSSALAVALSFKSLREYLLVVLRLAAGGGSFFRRALFHRRQVRHLRPAFRGRGGALGAGNAVILTLFQTTVPDAMKGRFFSVLTTLAYAVLPATFMLNGLLAGEILREFSASP